MTQIHYKNKKIVAFSDTHGKHREMRYINADIVSCDKFKILVSTSTER